MEDLLVYVGAYLIGTIPTKTRSKKGRGFWIKFILDGLKGAAAVTLARLVSPHDEPDWVLSGFLALAGDEFPFHSKFKGVRGLGVTVGVFAAILGWLLAR